MFSTDMRVAGFQSFMSLMFILMGCLICFAGAIMIESHRREETEVDYDLIPNYERVVKGKVFGNFIAFPTQMARATYNKMVKLGIVNGKVWKS